MEAPQQADRFAAPEGSPPITKNTFDVKGRFFLVTGSTQGLGRCVAIRLAQNGAAGILITGRNVTKGEQVTKEIIDLGSKAIFVSASLEDPEACRKIVTVAIETFGKLDGVVNCAALTTRASLETCTVDVWDSLMAVNVRAPFIITQEASEHMKKRGKGGSIVNISSYASYCGAPFIMAYSASKGAMNVLTKNNALELRPHRIRVNAVNMGWTATDSEDANTTAEKGPGWIAEADKAVPIGRILRVDDIANAVGFLLSDAASMITGTILSIHPDLIEGQLG